MASDGWSTVALISGLGLMSIVYAFSLEDPVLGFFGLLIIGGTVAFKVFP